MTPAPGGNAGKRTTDQAQPCVHAERLANDVEVVKAMRAARQAFSDGILDAAGSDRRDVRRVLTSDSVFQIAEFFFLLRCHGICTAEQIRSFGQLHNEYVQHAVTAPEKLEKLGRLRSQLEGAVFSDVGIEKLAENFMRKPPSFDQSDLCRFLLTQQSSENCRRSLVVLRETGLLDETRTAYGSVVLHSHGALERIYQGPHRHLPRIVGLGMAPWKQDTPA